ncbi:flagellar biosynthesis regulator FlaF [Aurantimonas sp. VKM B-3413]|uniref:flagellar biosynthesis regulator FlaF n=1 Tax=Aurantimonas sp. VKM B-3413 TaxID=2779401 RepID=UPI001E3D75A5|nr:flagellar biosynthesis regulator FlaF [Aurantimonas sp. VKM B-3413]MCB8838131.1 flagellar biosynthesis regulator FlaF [Aurantimonas sp. VKM B-3413]
MYQFSYAEVARDVEVDARERERRALDHSIELLRKAEKSGPRSRDAIEAIYTTRSLWAILVEDLSSSDNGLPEVLRAELISIGLWIMREAEAIRLGRSQNFAGIIEITTLIRDGLN